MSPLPRSSRQLTDERTVHVYMCHSHIHEGVCHYVLGYVMYTALGAMLHTQRDRLKDIFDARTLL